MTEPTALSVRRRCPLCGTVCRVEEGRFVSHPDMTMRCRGGRLTPDEAHRLWAERVEVGVAGLLGGMLRRYS